MKHVVIVALSDKARNDSCLMFATGFLKLQGMLLRKDIKASIIFSWNEAAMIESFVRTQEYDQLICIDTMIGFSPETILRMIDHPEPFMVGVHPLPGLNWDRLEKHVGKRDKDELTVDIEKIKNAGLGFNVAIAGAEDADGFAEVTMMQGRPDVYKIGRDVISAETFDAAHPIFGWTGRIVGDLRYQCTSFGAVDYVGCVGLRHVVR
jgi:hypothetical protein